MLMVKYQSSEASTKPIQWVSLPVSLKPSQKAFYPKPKLTQKV
jgi:hypothetical protein